MKINLHLSFDGNCREAFAFYADLFHTAPLMTITYGEMPGGNPYGEGINDLVLHTAMPVGGITLMGADSPPQIRHGHYGYMVSLDGLDEPEVRRIFDALSPGGRVHMPLQATFWSPLFGMVQDRFGTHWMISVASENTAAA